MSDFFLPAEWILRNKTELPWEALLGASIVTSDGRSLSVSGVKIRSWPDGPLLEVHYADEPDRQTRLFNIVGFQSGKLQTTYPAAEHVHTLRSFYENIERNRVASEKALAEVALHIALKSETRATSGVTLHTTFELLLFDLDDTLIKSGHLERLRGTSNLDNQDASYVDIVRAEAKHLDRLISPDHLIQIRKEFPDLQMGVFTRAPKTYARTLLEVCFPKVRWDCIISYEDVPGRTKPRPDGVILAASKTGVSDMSRVAVVGDHKNDLLAAYQAGAHAVLFRAGWGSEGYVRENYWALELMPDAIIGDPDDLPIFLARPSNFLPALEAWDAGISCDVTQTKMRVDWRKHFVNTCDETNGSKSVEIHAMGRYFPRSSARYDFILREQHHRLTSWILKAKDGTPYPDAWVDCCAQYIVRFAANRNTRSGNHLVVCTIPSSPSSASRVGIDRLEKFLGRISDRLGDDPRLLFDCGILKYVDGARPNKILNHSERLINVQRHLKVDKPYNVANQAILVLDDVVTSGATFFYADEYLRDAGAKSVHCLALAQTIS